MYYGYSDLLLTLLPISTNASVGMMWMAEMDGGLIDGWWRRAETRYGILMVEDRRD